VGAGKEDHSDGEVGFFNGEARVMEFASEELSRDLCEDAGAIGSKSIGTDRATVCEVRRSREPKLKKVVGGGAIDLGDETDATAVVFVDGVVEAFRGREFGVHSGRTSYSKSLDFWARSVRNSARKRIKTALFCYGNVSVAKSRDATEFRITSHACRG